MTNQIKGKHPGGRPTKYRANFHPEDFIRLSNLGKNITQIAKTWQISKNQIYEWGKKHPEFRDAIKRGREYCEGWYLELGQAAMVGMTQKPVNLGFYVWLTKNMFKWSDKVEIEETNIDVHEDLSDEELEKAAK